MAVARAVITALLVRVSTPGSAMLGLPLPLPGGRTRSAPPPPGGPGRLDSRMPGYLPSPSPRMPVSAVSALLGWGRCAKLPNCYRLVRSR
ncbi:hypothetical protein CP979_26140 [Streptomyces filamentosus]|nr:hypothetical protein CP979_26140 [Streptomyces filamentosus]